MMSDANFEQVTQMLFYALYRKNIFRETYFFQGEEVISGQRLVGGKLTVDSNFGATLKSTSSILKQCCPA